MDTNRVTITGKTDAEVAAAVASLERDDWCVADAGNPRCVELYRERRTAQCMRCGVEVAFEEQLCEACHAEVNS